jgi:hypothetical protein
MNPIILRAREEAERAAFDYRNARFDLVATEDAYARHQRALDALCAMAALSQPEVRQPDPATPQATTISPDEADARKWRDLCKNIDAEQVARFCAKYGTPQAAQAEPVVICGEAPVPIDADLIGCGKPIQSAAEVFRCADCGVPFHRQCAIRHFETDTPENADKVIEEQIRRLDAAAPAQGGQPGASGE